MCMCWVFCVGMFDCQKVFCNYNLVVAGFHFQYIYIYMFICYHNSLYFPISLSIRHWKVLSYYHLITIIYIYICIYLNFTILFELAI
jgi:hypothetical protein